MNTSVSKNLKNALIKSISFRTYEYLFKCIELYPSANRAEKQYIISSIEARGVYDPVEKAVTRAMIHRVESKPFTREELGTAEKILGEIFTSRKPVPEKKRDEIWGHLRSLGVSFSIYQSIVREYMTKRLQQYLSLTNFYDAMTEAQYLYKNPDLPAKYYSSVKAHLKLLTGFPNNKNTLNQKAWDLFNNNSSNIKTITTLAYNHVTLLNPKRKEDWIEVLEYDSVLRKAGARIQNPVYLATWKKIMWQLEQYDWEEYIGDIKEFTFRTLQDPQISPGVAKLASRAFLKLYETGELRNDDLMNVAPQYRKNILPTLKRKLRANGLNMARYTKDLLQSAKIRILCANGSSQRKRKSTQNNQACESKSFLYRAFQNKPNGDALEESALMYTYMTERGFRHVAGYGDKYKYLYKYEIIKPLPLLDLNRGMLCRPKYKEFLETSGLVNMDGNYAGSDPQPVKAYQEYIYTKRGIMGHVAVAQLDCHRKKIVQRSTIISRTKSRRYQPNFSRGVGTITRGLETNQRTRNAFVKKNYQKEVYGNAEVVLYLPKKRREYLRLVAIAKINAKGGLEPWAPV